MKNVDEIYRLSPMQAGMLYHCLAAPGDPVYFEQYLAQLDGALDAAAFRRAWTDVVARHPALRTAFVWEGLKEPLQVVRREVTVPWDVLDWRDRPPEAQPADLEELLRADRARPFILTQAPLMRLTLVRLAPERHALLWSFHHLLLDGWSCALVQQEVAERYIAGTLDQPLHVEPPAPFADYIRWLGRQDVTRAEQFWRARLEGVQPTSARFQPPAASDLEPDETAQLEIELSAEATARLAAGARGRNLALNTVCQAAWALVLARYASTSDVLFGATVSGRPLELPGVDRMVGLFINTLPVRVTLPARERVGPWLDRLQIEAAQARDHESAPLAEVQRWSGVTPGTPLFDSLFVYESYPRGGSTGAADGQAPPLPAPLSVRPLRTIEKTNYPLTLVVQPGARLQATLIVQRRRFALDGMSRVLTHWAAALDAVLADPACELRELSFLSNTERAQVLTMWQPPTTNEATATTASLSYRSPPDPLSPGTSGERGSRAARASFDLHSSGMMGDEALATPTGMRQAAVPSVAQSVLPPATLLERLERQAIDRPDAIAVVGDGHAVSYGAWHRRANRLARLLRAEGVGPDVPVAVLLPRTPDLVMALLAVWKAGGAYVPLDPQAPAARLAHLVKDVGARVLVTTDALATQVAQVVEVAELCCLCLDRDAARIAAQPGEAADAGVGADCLAYVIYTSGSTGAPKGVGITHGNVASLFAGTEAMFRFSPEDTWTLFHAAGFDFSVWEMWGALLYGGRLVVVSHEMARTPAAFAALVASEGVTVLNQTPSAFQAFQTAALEQSTPLALRLVIFGGEALAGDRLREWSARYGVAAPRLVNMYGITETTVHVTHHAMKVDDLTPGAGSRIGRAIPGWRLYLLDAAQQPVPVGVPGEIYVGGAGVARGYLGRPDLTATRFVPDPFGETPGGRLYRAGDLARWRADGVCEFLGRSDQQIKLRGYRIEPGEIEAALRELPDIRDALVLLREDRSGERGLVAWVVSASDDPPEPEDVRRRLQLKLPAYMVPGDIVPIETWPLTPNGKVDRRALPEPGGARGIARRAGEEYVAPRDAQELELARVWEELLHVHPVGVRDGFFELGGHSLLVVRLVAHIERTFNVRVPLADLARGTTIEQLAFTIRQLRTGPERRLVAMRSAASSQGAAPPIFAMVPAGGTLACYIDLAELMGDERPFYALQPRASLQETGPARTIERMARADLDELRAVQPSGPYFLIGWSMGGLLAYEMACLLRDAGEEVGLVALIDAGVPDLEQPARDPADLAAEEGARQLGLDPDALGELTGEARLEALFDLAQRSGRLANEVELTWVRWLADGFRLSVEALQQYRPRPYPGRVTLLRAGGPPPAEETDSTLGWGALARDGVDVDWVSGTHHTLVRRPHVETVAERLRVCLDLSRPVVAAPRIGEVADVR